jgi:hypothetical protein
MTKDIRNTPISVRMFGSGSIKMNREKYEKVIKNAQEIRVILATEW